MFEDLAGELGRWLGSMTRDMLGFFAKLALYTFMVACFWGLPWERILSKAGFAGKTYWTLYTLIVFPVWFFPGLFALIGADSTAVQSIGEVSGFAVYGAFIFVAIAPWPIRKKLKANALLHEAAVRGNTKNDPRQQ